MRIAQFSSLSDLQLGAGPHYNFSAHVEQKYHEVYDFQSSEKRNFRGIGPEVAWDGSVAALGNPVDGQVTFDWGINAGVLFGRQIAVLHHAVQHCRINSFQPLNTCVGDVEITEPADDTNRSRTVTVPNLGGYAGLSVRYTDAKVSLGYRADTFFGAMDGGQDTAKRENRGFYGPYLNVSLGFGG